MKILIFSTAYYPLMSGAEMAVDEITKRLDNWQFDLITARMDRKLACHEKYNQVNIYRTGFGLGAIDKFLLPFFGYIKARKLHKKNNYQAAWSLMASQASIAASFLKSKYPEIKLVLTLQEGDEEEYLKRYVGGSNFLYELLIRPWHLLVLKKADCLTAISQYLKSRARKNGFKKEIAIIPNGVDFEKFFKEFLPTELAETRAQLGLKAGDKLLIHTGRLNYKNGLDDVIRSLARLPANVKFLNIGVGEEQENLAELAWSLKVEDRVTFLDFKPHAEMVKYLKVADIFVRPSLSEGLGSSFLEAMAAELPVIATPVGGIPDFLKDRQTGLFCAARNPKDLAEKVKLILENKELRQKIIKQGRELVREKYGWDKIAFDIKMVFSSQEKAS